MLFDLDWAAVVFRYARAFSWTPEMSVTQCGITQGHLVFGPERDDHGIQQPQAQSPAEHLAIINASRARKGLPPLER